MLSIQINNIVNIDTAIRALTSVNLNIYGFPFTYLKFWHGFIFNLHQGLAHYGLRAKSGLLPFLEIIFLLEYSYTHLFTYYL